MNLSTGSTKQEMICSASGGTNILLLKECKSRMRNCSINMHAAEMKLSVSHGFIQDQES